MNVLPAIDLRDGKCVRLRQGDFDQQTVYDVDPLEVARSYRDSGFEQLHIVDLDGARSGTQKHQALVARIVDDTGMIVQLGGGIRERETVAHWLNSGVTRCVIGSVAVEDPAAVRGWVREFGVDAIVLALDVRTDVDREPRLAIHGWTENSGTTLWQAIERYRDVDARHVLCTDVGRDGMMTGPNLALYADLLRRYPEIRLQASGGVRDIEDLAALRDAGCAAAITGRALLDELLTPGEVKSFLRDA